MEERRVTISRAKVAIDFPANFMLIASMNPCPSVSIIIRKRNAHVSMSCAEIDKISGPLLDRIDLHVEVTPVAFSELSNKTTKARIIF